uniref:Hexosyltransferase n=1 Tax=Rhizophora mucronata TaxID=61149 RepID=A0A2P2LNH8_RHIMU
MRGYCLQPTIKIKFRGLIPSESSFFPLTRRKAGQTVGMMSG